MAKSFAQSKGARGERGVIELLQPIVDKVYTECGWNISDIPKLQRNTLQSDGGGCDLAGLHWLALEIKSQESLNLNSWVRQTLAQAKAGQTPVLFYKQSRVPWKVQCYGLLATNGPTNIRVWCEVSVDSFLVFFEHKLRHEVSKL